MTPPPRSWRTPYSMDPEAVSRALQGRLAALKALRSLAVDELERLRVEEELIRRIKISTPSTVLEDNGIVLGVFERAAAGRGLSLEEEEDAGMM